MKTSTKKVSTLLFRSSSRWILLISKCKNLITFFQYTIFFVLQFVCKRNACSTCHTLDQHWGSRTEFRFSAVARKGLFKSIQSKVEGNSTTYCIGMCSQDLHRSSIDFDGPGSQIKQIHDVLPHTQTIN